MRAHAIANHVFVIAVNRVGKEGHLDFWGNSFCIDPYGRILERNGQNETISHLDLDLKVIDEANRYWPYFRDRRVDAFNDLLKIWVE
jgi:N-carbamoylputrescine amidase